MLQKFSKKNRLMKETVCYDTRIYGPDQPDHPYSLKRAFAVLVFLQSLNNIAAEYIEEERS